MNEASIKPYRKRRADAIRTMKSVNERKAVTMRRRVYLGIAHFSPEEARGLADELERRHAPDIAASLRAAAARIDAGEADDVKAGPPRETPYVCDMPCCNDPPPLTFIERLMLAARRQGRAVRELF